MSKAAVDTMTRSLAVEWGRYGIRLNTIAPGTIPTEGMYARLRPGDNDPTAKAAANNPMGRVGRHPELANMAAFLMCEEVEYINGEVIAIEGGAGIMGSGTFSSMLGYTDQDWQKIREAIQSTNAADKTKRG